jgi:hypothetical protein
MQEGLTLSAQFLSEDSSDALVELLEKKHLYQKVTIDLEPSLDKTRNFVMSHLSDSFTLGKYKYRASKFGLAERARTSSMVGLPTLLLQNIKIFCHDCDAAEVFSPLWYRELGEEIRATKVDNPTLEIPFNEMFQVFVLAYQCQRCKSDPVTFVVRRHKWNLILDGRSPMEQVEVPREIPRQEAGFFRDSIIAYQSGKPLAGILYLRVFLEAFARRQTGCTTRATGDELMEAYAQLLPLEKRSLMPSLKEWYGSLSEAIHAGREDADLFQTASGEIHRHFEFRRLFQIPDISAPLVQDADSVPPPQQ